MNKEFSSLARGKDILTSLEIIASEVDFCPIELVHNSLIRMVASIKF